MSQHMRTAADLLSDYNCYLQTYNPSWYKSFHKRTTPESARAEAVVFSFFQRSGYNIQLEEKPNRGGVDFRVQKNNAEYVVEVASIGRKAFGECYGIPEEPINGKGYSTNKLCKVANKIRSEAARKAKQMSGYKCPSILVIACEHPEYASILHDTGPTGPAMFHTGLPNFDNETNLATSLFLKFQNDKVGFCRKSISAVLLFYIHQRVRSEIVGLLHPEPTYNFSSELLPSAPFVEALVSVRDSYFIETRRIPHDSPVALFWY